MSKKEYDNFIKEFKKYLRIECQLKKEFLVYGPLSSAYWNSNIKILYCNLEPYKFSSKANGKQVTYNFMLKEGWIYNKTIKKTADQILNLMETIEKKIPNSFNDLKIKEPTDILKKVAYLNWRPTKNRTGTISADIKNIYSWVNKLKDQYIELLETLQPDIIIVSSVKKGKTIFNTIFRDCKIKNNNIAVINLKNKKSIVCFTTHPSRISNKELNENSTKIVRALIQK